MTTVEQRRAWILSHVFLVAEGGSGQDAGRLVDRDDEGQSRPGDSSQSWRLPSSWRRRPA